jgi:hypothetical protein
MTTIDGRWILLAALLGALALLVPAVTAGGIGTTSDAPVLANESNGSTAHWADAHHAAHHDGDDWEDHDQYHPHNANATDGSYHGEYGPHHAWNATEKGEYGPHHAWNATDHDEYGSHHHEYDDHEEYGPNHAWNATGDDTERGTATSGGSGWGHGNGHGC